LRLSSLRGALVAASVLALASTTDVRAQRVEGTAMHKDAASTLFKSSPADTVFRKREVVVLRFMADAKPDSVSALRPAGFKIVSGPATRREFTLKDGVSTDLHGVVY